MSGRETAGTVGVDPSSGRETACNLLLAVGRPLSGRKTAKP